MQMQGKFRRRCSLRFLQCQPHRTEDATCHEPQARIANIGDNQDTILSLTFTPSFRLNLQLIGMARLAALERGDSTLSLIHGILCEWRSWAVSGLGLSAQTS